MVPLNLFALRTFAVVIIWKLHLSSDSVSAGHKRFRDMDPTLCLGSKHGQPLKGKKDRKFYIALLRGAIFGCTENCLVYIAYRLRGAL